MTAVSKQSVFSIKAARAFASELFLGVLGRAIPALSISRQAGVAKGAAAASYSYRLYGREPCNSVDVYSQERQDDEELFRLPGTGSTAGDPEHNSRSK